MITSDSVRFKLKIDEMKMNINGNIIHDIEKDDYYIIYFDPSIYLQENQKDYQTIMDLIRRKDSKDTIIGGLYNMIKYYRPTKALKIIFSKLASEYKSTLITDDSIINSQSMKISQSHDFEISNLYSLMARKKSTIKPADICNDLFKLFLYDKKLDVEYLVEVIVMYINCIQKEKLKVHGSLFTILINFLRKTKRNMIPMLVQYQSVPDNFEFAMYIIHESKDNAKTFQIGLDMLKRLRKDNFVVLELIKKGYIEEGLIYAKKFKVTLETIPSDVLLLLQVSLKENKKLILDFIST